MKKILLVAEKTYTVDIIKKVLEENQNDFKDQYYFDFVKPVFHLNDSSLLLHKYQDNIYNSLGELETSLSEFKLTHLNIPNNTFLEAIKNENSFQNSKMTTNVDQIISICDWDNRGKLAFAKYLEENHIDFKDAECLNLIGLESDSLIKILKSKPLNFQDVFDDLKIKLEKNNFESEIPKPKDLRYLRFEARMSKEEISNYFNIPLETIKNWEKNKENFPQYMYDLMYYKLYNEKVFIKTK